MAIETVDPTAEVREPADSRVKDILCISMLSAICRVASMVGDREGKGGKKINR